MALRLDNFEQMAGPVIAQRGRNYFRSGRVTECVEENGEVKAVVMGSERYKVKMDVEENGTIRFHSCTCPFDDAILCKHEAAVLYYLREQRKNIVCADAVLDYIIQIAEATRKDERISLGVSPRGCIALTEAAMANAMFSGRDFTLPDDVQKLALLVLSHRIVLDRRSNIRGETRSSILSSIIREIKVPAVS